VQERNLATEARLDAAPNELPHLGKLAEDQCRLAGLEHFLEHLFEPGQLSRAAGERRVVAGKLRGMIADLLELRERAENLAASLDAFFLRERCVKVSKDRGVEPVTTIA
jgi:hypothetical protein